MDIAIIVLLVGILIFASHLFAWLFSFTKIPDVLLLMLVGLLLGPWLQVITPDFFGDAAPLWVTIALVVILFEGATKLRLDVLVKSWRDTTLLSVGSFLVTMVTVGSIVWLYTGIHPVLAFMVGAIVGDNAVALILPMLERLQIIPQSRTTLFLESAVSDVLSIVVALGLLHAYELGMFRIDYVLAHIAVSFVVAASIGVLCAFMWSVLLNKVRLMQNSVFATPAFVFVVFGIVEGMGMSGLVAAIAFGVALGNIPFLQRWLQEQHSVLHAFFHPLSLNAPEKAFFSEVVFVLQTFFFVYIGLSVTLARASVVLLGLGIVFAMLAMRLLVTRAVLSRNVPASDASIISIMIPRGLATAVLGSMALQRGIEEGPLIQEITYTVVLWSIVVTSLCVFLLQKTFLINVFASAMGTKGRPAKAPEETAVIASEKGETLPDAR